MIEQPVHVVASPFKTGTTSVGRALVELGVGKRQMRYDGKLLKQLRPAIRAANRLVEPKMDFTTFAAQHQTAIRNTLKPLVQAIAPFDVFHDAPFGHSHIHPFVCKVLAPNARFIWIERDTDDWLDSVRRWEQSHPDLYRRHTEWTTAPQDAIDRRMKRLKRARRGFRRIQRCAPDDCLVLEWSDLRSFDALAAFYNVPVPRIAFPEMNVTGR